MQENLAKLEQAHPPPAATAADAEPAPEIKDLRWPGIVMGLLILAAFWSPLVTLAGAAVAWLIADREQAVVLAAIGAVLLLLSRTLGA